MNAHEINDVTVPDIGKAEPVQELLQRFNGVKVHHHAGFDVAFLQVSLK
jgi:ribonuclease D